MKPSSILHGKSLWTSIIVMLLISLAMVPIVAEAEITNVGTYFWVDPPNISPPNINKTVCEQFEVNIMIEDAPETYAWEATLKFDNNTLGVMSVSEGPWLSEDDTKDTTFTTTSWVEANKTGTISIGCTLLGEVPGTSGSGVLCTIVFHVELCGRSPLDLQDTALLDMNLRRTDYPNNDGFFCAVCAFPCLHDVAILDVTALPTDVEQGIPVTITVIIKNQGNHTQHVNVTVSATYELDPEIFIGKNSCTTIDPNEERPVIFVWDTTLVPGEKYKIKTEVVKTDAEDDDPHDNVFIGPEVRVRCPIDIKVADVKVLTPWLYLCFDASVDITVVNEGTTQQTFDVEVYADGSKVDTIVGVTLAADSSTTVTGTWHPDAPGTYVISAKVPPLIGEKDTADNEKVDGTVKVIYDDVAITDVSISPTLVNWGGSVDINITVMNNGTDFVKFMVTVWADPTPAAPFSGDERLMGVVVGGYLGAGANITFSGLAPYGNISTSDYTLSPPFYPLTNRTYYGIFALVIKLSGLDLNANNDVGYGGVLIVGEYSNVYDVNVPYCTVNVLDVLLVKLNLGSVPPVDWKFDVNVPYGVVNVLDVLLVKLNLGPC